MKNSKRFNVLLSAAIILIAAFSTYTQTKRADFNRPQSFDVQHYVIRVSFDRAKKEVIGDTTIILRPLKDDFSSLEMDAVDLKFRSISLEPEGTSLGYSKTNAGTMSIGLGRSYGPGDTISLRFTYTTKPSKGVYFSDAGEGHSAQIWTQGEPDEARHWFPSFDFPSDKATTEQYITAQPNETVIGNGELLDKSTNSDGSVTWHYKMPVPHSTYLVSFVIGQYVKIEDAYKSIPLGFYTYPGREETARKAFGDTKKMVAVFEDLTGLSFPYNKYDQTLVSNFQFGGMENITATTMADTEIFFADFDFGKNTVTDLVSHELAHSWFGNLVTCRNWAELWLNEGFATYMEAAYREKVNGRGDYMRKIRSDAAEFLVDDSVNRRRHGLFNQRAIDINSLFDNAATTYNKGGAVIHTLREQVGTEKFWKGVNLYLSRHKFGSVESTDLQKAFEETSGQDLSWFFDQWVYGAGAPRIDVKQVYSTRSKTLTLTVSQTQLTDVITPAAFRLPLDIVIKTASGRSNERIEVTKRVQTFTFSPTGKPTGLEIDEDLKIPLKKLRIRPLTFRR